MKHKIVFISLLVVFASFLGLNLSVVHAQGCDSSGIAFLPGTIDSATFDSYVNSNWCTTSGACPASVDSTSCDGFPRSSVADTSNEDTVVNSLPSDWCKACETQTTGVQPPFGGDLGDLNALAEKALKVAVTAGFPVAVIFLMYSGFLFITAQGKQEELTKAKETLGWTIAGTALLLGAGPLGNAIAETVKDLVQGV